MTGTIRLQLTKDERADWADLLCLAGLSRFPGIIASGYESDDKSPLMGQSLNWMAAQMDTDAQALRTLLHKLEAQQRITVTEKMAPNGQYNLYVITIVSWGKYQSEYQLKRQRRKYNEPARSDSDYQRTNVHTKSAETPTEEVEVDKRESSVVHQKHEQHTLTPFAQWWAVYPKKLGRKRAERAWNRLKESDRKAALSGLEVWKQTEQWQKDNGQYIPYAEKFINQGLFSERPAVETTDEYHIDRAQVQKAEDDYDKLIKGIAADEPGGVGRSVRKKTIP